MRREEEIDLVRKAKGGRHRAFAEIDPPVPESRVRHGVPDSERSALAEDVAQEAFVTAFRSLRDLRTESSFPPWLRKIRGTSPWRRARNSAVSGRSKRRESFNPPRRMPDRRPRGSGASRRVRGGGEASRPDGSEGSSRAGSPRRKGIRPRSSGTPGTGAGPRRLRDEGDVLRLVQVPALLPADGMAVRADSGFERTFSRDVGIFRAVDVLAAGGFEPGCQHRLPPPFPDVRSLSWI